MPFICKAYVSLSLLTITIEIETCQVGKANAFLLLIIKVES